MSCDQRGTRAATAPRRGRPQATAVDGALSALERAACVGRKAGRRVSKGDSTRHTHGRVAGRAVHSLTPLAPPPPLARRPLSAGVDSPPRVGPRRGRVDRSPLPCAPPLPLPALPTRRRNALNTTDVFQIRYIAETIRKGRIHDLGGYRSHFRGKTGPDPCGVCREPFECDSQTISHRVKWRDS